MRPFWPEQVFIEEAALGYALGAELSRRFAARGVPVEVVRPRQRIAGRRGGSPGEGYRQAKKILVVGVRRDLAFRTCRPSADYEVPVVSGCPAGCEYCYLATSLGARPYIRVYANVGEMREAMRSHVAKNLPRVTVFELSSTGDPVPVEHFTGALGLLLEFIGREEHGRARLVTKSAQVGPLLDVQHQGHTVFRFSVNARRVIDRFEHGTPSLDERVEAARMVAGVAYPLGFVVAPIMRGEGWREGYRGMFRDLAEGLGRVARRPMRFELITHRFTPAAKRLVEARFPDTALDMCEADRVLRRGRYGVGKYVYPPEAMRELRRFFAEEIFGRFPAAKIDYFI